MFVAVVRFSCDGGAVESDVASLNETGPPPRTETFAAMDSSETPGSRVSVDTGELKVERAL
jgi:hypothetical protein